MRYISGTKLDERVIRCDLDPGYIEGRQFGRGKSGGQVRDEYREEYDGGRGGWGHDVLRRQNQAEKRLQGHYDTYASEVGGLGMAGADVPTGEGYERDNRKRGREEDDEDDDRIVSQSLQSVVCEFSLRLSISRLRNCEGSGTKTMRSDRRT